MAGILFERDNFIPNCQNRAGIAETNVDGGALLNEGAIVKGDDELYTLTFATASTKRVAVAYNPSVKYDIIGENLYPAVSSDDRNYTNPKGRPVDYFFPEVGIEFGVIKANIDGDTVPTVGKFLEVGTNGKYVIKNTQTASVPSFEVVQIMDVKYPTLNFNEDVEKVYIVKTRANG